MKTSSKIIILISINVVIVLFWFLYLKNGKILELTNLKEKEDIEVVRIKPIKNVLLTKLSKNRKLRLLIPIEFTIKNNKKSDIKIGIISAFKTDRVYAPYIENKEKKIDHDFLKIEPKIIKPNKYAYYKVYIYYDMLITKDFNPIKFNETIQDTIKFSSLEDFKKKHQDYYYNYIINQEDYVSIDIETYDEENVFNLVEKNVFFDSKFRNDY